MLHSAHVWEKPDNEQNPWHIECSCGTAGDFPNEEAARAWMEGRHFGRLTGYFTTELIAGDPSKPQPKTDSTTAGPPAPPPPPPAKVA
jgi:hypothetical protein